MLKQWLSSILNAPNADIAAVIDVVTEQDWQPMDDAITKLANGHLKESLLKADSSFYQNVVMYHVLMKDRQFTSSVSSLTTTRNAKGSDNYSMSATMTLTKPDGPSDVVQIGGIIQFLPDSETINFLQLTGDFMKNILLPVSTE